MEQIGKGSDPKSPQHPSDLRCARCNSAIVDDSSLETRGDDAYCCRNCAEAVTMPRRYAEMSKSERRA